MSVLTELNIEAYDSKVFDDFRPVDHFSIENARASMWLAQLSYEVKDESKVKTLLGAWDLRLVPRGIVSMSVVTPLPVARTEAFIARGRGAAFLVFAGTDPLVAANWVSDFDIRPHHGGTTMGFAQAVNPIVPVLRELLDGLEEPLFVIGHSLGGALAVLAALPLAEGGLRVAGVYTFGMPRPGNQAFQSRYDKRLGTATYRLVNGSDIVPTVAPSLLKFHHVGRLLWRTTGTRFDPTALSEEPGSNEPNFERGIAAALLAPFRAPVRDWLALGGALDPDRTRPVWAGRPDAVRLLLSLQSRRILDHLPDSYIAALT